MSLEQKMNNKELKSYKKCNDYLEKIYVIIKNIKYNYTCIDDIWMG
jgi:hypothetical protein